MANPILDTFFEEADELLEQLAEGLARMRGADPDAEVLNSIFRAVHSIKGGAGAFKLTDLVAFAHHFETVLDALRSGTLDLTPAIMHTLTRSADFLTDLVEAARDGAAIAPDLSAGFLQALQACLGDMAIEAVDAWDNFEFAAITLDLSPLDEPLVTGFHITFRPHAMLYANGHEPALLFAALAELGSLTTTLDQSGLPDWDAFDPMQPRLSWRLDLRTDDTETAVQEVFEFVHGLCDLTIAPLRPTALPEPQAAPLAVLAPLIPAAEPAAKATLDDKPETRGPKPTLRVDLDRVDRLINAVGELIINQAMIAQRFADLTGAADEDLGLHIEDYRLLARDIQEGVMAIRAQPVKSLFQRMSRIVREVSGDTGKPADLITQGEATEVDKTLVERLADPLTHMIRNAVDHGLEDAATRVAAGKPAIGTIRLSASHRSGSVVITVKDDGAGLNRPKILDIARRKGLVAPDADLSDTEIDGLLFLPGFSTATAVSNLSGRGVGLDVVRNAVAALGGRITIVSVPGQGTEFTILLPLTLAVMDGMVVEVGGQTLVVPITSIIETIRPQPADLHRIGTDDILLSVRGRMVPVIDVARSLGFRAEAEAATMPYLLLVESEALGTCALVVDAVQDQRQVVIKSLESNFGAVAGVSAATVLGDGRIALILDTEAIAASRKPPHLHAAHSPFDTGRTPHAHA